MDNEQLLTNGICPNCYRPLYESKHTDKILCDCGIMTQPMDRLKEIREKYYTPDHNGLKGDFSNEEVKEIQQASYNLGRDEVIDEIEKICEPYYMKHEGWGEIEFISKGKLTALLTSLK